MMGSCLPHIFFHLQLSGNGSRYIYKSNTVEWDVNPQVNQASEFRECDGPAKHLLILEGQIVMPYVISRVIEGVLCIGFTHTQVYILVYP